MNVDYRTRSTPVTADAASTASAQDSPGGRLAAHAVRLVDQIGIAIISALVVVVEAPGPVRDAPRSLVAPVSIGAVVTSKGR